MHTRGNQIKLPGTSTMLWRWIDVIFYSGLCYWFTVNSLFRVDLQYYLFVILSSTFWRVDSGFYDAFTRYSGLYDSITRGGTRITTVFGRIDLRQ